jgi:quinol-cytochrome oxidoreductase complex cytochrome b subunit
MRGGDEVTASTLRRAYGFHVAVLPAALTLLLVLHAGVLRGLARHAGPVEPESEGTIPIYPDFFVRMGVAVFGLLAIVISLATFVDRPLGAAASIGATPAAARPPWYFLFVHDLLIRAPREILGVSGAKFIVGSGSLLVLMAFFVPFFDRRGSRITAVIAAILLILAVGLSIHALV